MATESAFDRVRATDPTVHRMLRAGRTLDELIVALVCEKNRLLQYVMVLESIAPRKIALPDGTVMIWRCPDELVPDRPLLAAKFVTCPGCGNVIEPAICWCGDYIKQHGDSGHSPVPMGCDCGRVKMEDTNHVPG